MPVLRGNHHHSKAIHQGRAGIGADARSAARQPHRCVRRRQSGKASQGAGARQTERTAVKKSSVPLEVAVKGAAKKIRIHTIRHSTCIESGHDRFDEKTSEFLNEVGETNLIGVHTVNYTFLDIGTQKILTDFGLLIVYRG